MRSATQREHRLARVAGLAAAGVLVVLLFVWSWAIGLVVVVAGAVAMLAASEPPGVRRPRRVELGSRRPAPRRGLDVGWATSAIDLGRSGVQSVAGRARRRMSSAVQAGAAPGQRGEALGIVLLSLLLTACAAGFVVYAMAP
jgi:hypothetical protein